MPSPIPIPPDSDKWWKEATGYQIWPASFRDSSGDGTGDINGITLSLDYLKTLGIDFIWISPVYDSPGHDMGYDIRDYEQIWARVGNMADMDTLIKEAKARGLRVIMDLVVNHTSHEHRWFQESKKSRTNPYSDWYIWRNPRFTEQGERKAPSNWRGVFGGSVWTYVPERDQYYLHLSLSEQPDLNWENEETRRAVHASAIEFWLQKGVDGFRVDMVNAYWKDPRFPDVPIVDNDQEFQPMDLAYVLNGPKVHEWLKEERVEVLDRYGKDIVMIGELPATDRDEVLRYVSAESRELDMTIDFNLFIAGNHWSVKLHDMRRAKLPEVKEAISKTQGLLSGTSAWTTTFLENHDSARSVSHFGPGEGEHMIPAAKMLALLVSTLSGTLIIYQGQEIGMTNVPQNWKKEDFKDEAILRYFREIEELFPGDEEMMKRAHKAALDRGRDNCRTPMQWSSESPSGGFSMGDPWIGVNPNYQSINVAAQLQDENSVLAFWKSAIATRKENGDLFIHGEYHLVDQENELTFAFWKRGRGISGRAAFVVLNFSSEEVEVNFPEDVEKGSLELLISTAKGENCLWGRLEAWEGRAYIKQ
ncbi:MAG: hypothetical protein Q9187_000878 [Circinaria calcarea]